MSREVRFGEFLILPRRFRRVLADVGRLVGGRGHVVGVRLLGWDSMGYPLTACSSALKMASCLLTILTSLVGYTQLT